MALLLKSLPADGSTPKTSQAMKFVNNKNNKVEQRLRKTLDQYSRERTLSMYQLDQERLDIHDFLRDLKRCESNESPEAKRYVKIIKITKYCVLSRTKTLLQVFVLQS